VEQNAALEAAGCYVATAGCTAPCAKPHGAESRAEDLRLPTGNRELQNGSAETTEETFFVGSLVMLRGSASWSALAAEEQKQTNEALEM
jgi:hypothetical protein